MDNNTIASSMTIKLDNVLPEAGTFEPGIRRAPDRSLSLNKFEIKLALKNALRYIPEELHSVAAP